MTIYTGMSGDCGTSQQVRFIDGWEASASASNIIELSANLEVRDL
jgi:hypothetical protein